MLNVESVMTDLKKKGDEKRRQMYERHGAPAGRMFGVSIADLKAIAKKLKGQQTLATELYETGNLDAMYLAGMVANGSQMSKAQLKTWARRADWSMIAEFTVPGVAAESAHARELALDWMASPQEYVAAAGWSTYTGIVATTPDEQLDLAEIESLLERVVKALPTAPNRVRYTMNGFVIAVGSHVKPLLARAKATARAIGVVTVDMGDTACQVPLATTYIQKVETAGRVGQKRKTMKC